MSVTLKGRVDCQEPMRLDTYIADSLKAMSRSQLKTRYREARVNGRAVKLSRLVQADDLYELELAELPDTSLVPERLPLDILFEDAQVVVVNKAQGMVTHPAHGNWQGTLANALAGHLLEAGGDLPPRAGIVHRLDKDTSGLIIAAKNSAAQDFLARQFRERSTRKTYLALVHGSPPQASGRIDDWLARDPRDRKRFAQAATGKGKRAVSDYRLLAAARGYSLLLLRPKTGRTHQLRVHCRGLGCPIVGDPLYGRRTGRQPAASLLLHAWRLEICLPGGDEASRFSAPLPGHFMAALVALGIAWPLAENGMGKNVFS